MYCWIGSFLNFFFFPSLLAREHYRHTTEFQGIFPLDHLQFGETKRGLVGVLVQHPLRVEPEPGPAEIALVLSEDDPLDDAGDGLRRIGRANGLTQRAHLAPQHGVRQAQTGPAGHHLATNEGATLRTPKTQNIPIQIKISQRLRNISFSSLNKI